MNRRLWLCLVALPWLALPVTAWRYWQVWDGLPALMATHFDLNGNANGWMSRETSLAFALGITLFLLVVFTGVTYAIHRRYAGNATTLATLGFFYLMIGVIYSVNSGLVEHNLSGRPVDVKGPLILLPVAIVVLTAVYLGSHRGRTLPAAPVLAEEVHAVRWWTLVFVVPLIAELAVLLTIPAAPVRAGAALLALLFMGFAALTWNGFRYRFTSAGVEILTMGLRLRSIPAADIRGYEAGSWNAWRGYGIRGIGACRAYVWSNRGVRIRTTNGEIFLGHGEPERILRDLDAIKQFAH